jgi:glucose-1-phosphate thymidylyltransferase
VPVISKGIWSDAIFAWDLLNANNLALGMKDTTISGEVEEGAVIKGPVEIGRGSIVRSGSYLVGPVCIGEDCDIGPSVTILPSTSIGDSVRIGSHSEVRNSIIMNDVRIGTGAIISDAVIGASCTLGDQLVIETGPTVVDLEDAFERAEFGAIFADDVTVGGRVLASPGTIVGTGARIGSGASVHGWIERESRVIS